jgi:hypothetical protein
MNTPTASTSFMQKQIKIGNKSYSLVIILAILSICPICCIGTWLYSLTPQYRESAIQTSVAQTSVAQSVETVSPPKKTTAPTSASTNTPIATSTKTIPPSTTATLAEESRCVSASEGQLARIRSGVKQIQGSNDIKTAYAVKSKDFENVWMVAAIIYGPSIESGTGPGIWAINGNLDNPGITLSVDEFAKQFSDWPDASTTDAAITIAADGVTEAQNCAENQIDTPSGNKSIQATSENQLTSTSTRQPTNTLKPSVTTRPTKTTRPTDTRMPTATEGPASVGGEHPANTSGRCVDGSYTSAAHRQGACSHHGGIAEWWGN